MVSFHYLEANTDAFRFAFARLDSSKEALETMLAEAHWTFAS